MLKIKTPKRYIQQQDNRHIFVFLLIAVFWAITAFAIDNRYVAMALCAVWTILAFTIYNRFEKKYRWDAFKCPECGFENVETVANDGADGDPILVLCNDCEILWHIGYISND